MSNTLAIVVQTVQQLGAAETARRLEVSRTALTSYLANACRHVTRSTIESRASRLAKPTPGTP